MSWEMAGGDAPVQIPGADRGGLLRQGDNPLCQPPHIPEIQQQKAETGRGEGDDLDHLALAQLA